MTDLLTKTQAAVRLGCSERTLERRISKGLLPVVRVGPKCVMVRPADVNAYINSHTRESVTKTTDFIGKSVAAKGEASEADLIDAIHATVPKSVIQAQKEARIQVVMDAFSCPRDDAKALIKAQKKRRKKARRQSQRQLTRVVRDLPAGSLPSSAVAANKARLAATADSAINKMMAESAELPRKSTPVITKSASKTDDPAGRNIRRVMASICNRIAETSPDPLEREMAAKAFEQFYFGER